MVDESVGPCIPPLVSGGVMLTYRCTNACRHCLYRCSPKRVDDWMSLEAAERVFAALAREPRLGAAGLLAILVSASMFHNEFVPFERTRNCVEVGTEVFGAKGVIVWQPHLYQALDRMGDHERTHTLREFCDTFGLPPWSPEMPSLYGVIPGGRAAGDVDDLHRSILEDEFPVLSRLAAGGPFALARWAREEFGVAPDRDEFAS